MSLVESLLSRTTFWPFVSSFCQHHKTEREKERESSREREREKERKREKKETNQKVPVIETNLEEFFVLKGGKVDEEIVDLAGGKRIDPFDGLTVCSHRTREEKGQIVDQFLSFVFHAKLFEIFGTGKTKREQRDRKQGEKEGEKKERKRQTGSRGDQTEETVKDSVSHFKLELETFWVWGIVWDRRDFSETLERIAGEGGNCKELFSTINSHSSFTKRSVFVCWFITWPKKEREGEKGWKRTRRRVGMRSVSKMKEGEIQVRKPRRALRVDLTRGID